MTYVACCLCLLYGPIPLESFPEEVAAESPFAFLERTTGKAVRRQDPTLDTTLIAFRDKSGMSESVLIVLLRAHGVYVHRRVRLDGTVELVATRSAKPPPKEERRVIARVYSPQHVKPETLLETLSARGVAEGVSVILEPRTGKLIVTGEEVGPITAALELLRSLDRPPEPVLGVRLFRCRSKLVREAHEELVQLLPRDLRRRVVVVPYPQGNALLLSCGSRDWEAVLPMLLRVDPEGEVVEREK